MPLTESTGVYRLFEERYKSWEEPLRKVAPAAVEVDLAEPAPHHHVVLMMPRVLRGQFRFAAEGKIDSIGVELHD